MRPVIRLQGRVIQTRVIDAGTPVGYSHTWRATRRSRIATVAAGYADGYLRSLSNRGYVQFDVTRLPVVGNVSMDTILVDVSDLGEDMIREGSLVDLAGPDLGVDDIASRAGTIGYEILTSLGNRYARSYVGG
jgi:alanine racemase